MAHDKAGERILEALLGAAEAFGGLTDLGPRETGHRYGAGSHCIDMAVDEFHALVTFTVIGHPCDA